jgi:hypothetical protein
LLNEIDSESYPSCSNGTHQQQHQAGLAKDANVVTIGQGLRSDAAASFSTLWN